MRSKLLSHVAAASALLVAPVAASAQPAANPAASLSVAKSVRASAPTGKKSQLAGTGLFAALIAAGVAAIVIVAVANDSNSSSP